VTATSCFVQNLRLKVLICDFFTAVVGKVQQIFNCYNLVVVAKNLLVMHGLMHTITSIGKVDNN